MSAALWLGAGVFVGTIGTLIGAGGGFLLVPLLVLAMPDASPSAITAISLSAVSANAWSGSIAYARKGRVSYRHALIFGLCSVPGVVLGVRATWHLDRHTFLSLFVAPLVVLAIFVLVRGERGGDGPAPPTDTRAVYLKGGVLSALIAVVATILGIGGGLLHVPMFVYVLGFAPHMATATSHATLALTATLAAALHYFAGDLVGEYGRVLAIAGGMIAGAQLGARLSPRVQGPWIMRVLGVALLFVALRLALIAWR
ncbi:MAG: sulfite exporter TauE/SafE family protein [Deltaproteobacteria bacterium]|nr:sulfite exporter TauE/SafE family protein [Deltaproteobacteria bacterium]